MAITNEDILCRKHEHDLIDSILKLNDCLLNTKISYFVSAEDAAVLGIYHTFTQIGLLFVQIANYNYYLFIVQTTIFMVQD